MELFNIDADVVASIQDMTEEETHSFAALHNNPSSDEEVELYIFIHMHIFKHSHALKDLVQAALRAESWAASTPTSHSDHARRHQILENTITWQQQCKLVEEPAEISHSEPAALEFRRSDVSDQSVRLAKEYARTNRLEDLNVAIRIAQLAVDNTDGPTEPDILSNLEVMLGAQFDRTGTLEDLDRIIQYSTRAVESIARDHPDYAGYRNDLGSWLGARFERTGQIEDLHRAIDLTNEALEASDPSSQNWSGYMNNLGNWLGRLYERTRSADDLDRAIHFANKVTSSTPKDNPNYAGWLGNLGNKIGRRFELTGSMDDMSHAIDITTKVVEATPDDHPRYMTRLSNLGSWITKRFETTGSLHDINQAIDIATRIKDVIPEDSSGYTDCLSLLATWLGKLFERTDSMNDLGRAIEIMTGVTWISKAIEATAHDQPRLANCFVNLGNWLNRRFEITGSMDDLNRSIEIARKAADFLPDDHSQYAACLNNLGWLFCTRYETLGSKDDLNEAIISATKAVESVPTEHSERPRYLSNLADKLGLRFVMTGSMDDLDRAITYSNMSAEAAPEDLPSLAYYLSNLSSRLGDRCLRNGSMTDLDLAIQNAERRIEATAQSDMKYPGRLSNLATWHGERYSRTGASDDLDRAIDLMTRATDVAPKDHLDYPTYLTNLGSSLVLRFERLGSMEDLDHAIDTSITAVKAMPESHPNRASCIDDLGNCFGQRFERKGLYEDLNEAIRYCTSSVETTLPDHADYAGRLNNLGLWLDKRSEETGSQQDLDRSIDLATRALDATPLDHPNRANRLNNLGQRVFHRAKVLGSLKDLDFSIECSTSAVDLTFQSHPRYAVNLKNLGTMLGERYRRTNKTKDLNRQLSSYTACCGCTSAHPYVRIQAAQAAAYIHAQRDEWQEASKLHDEAVLLLPRIHPRSIRGVDAETMLDRQPGLASMAAAAALNASKSPTHCLQLLELGRGIINGLVMDTRTDISDLEIVRPDLAAAFASLRDELDSPMHRTTATETGTSAVSSRELRMKRLQTAEAEFQDLTERIRAVPQFHNFPGPPTEAELIRTADPAPLVVINASTYRCDAFLVTSKGIRLLELLDLTFDDMIEHFEQLQRSTSNLTPWLEWLWDVICRPCLEELGFTDEINEDGDWPRVWWIPTGPLSQLPLHAAGYYDQPCKDSVLDRVISSYASSIKALLHGRRQPVRSIAPSQSGPAVVVPMQTTPGLPGDGALPFAAMEIDMIAQLCTSLELRVEKPTRRRDEVLKQLQGCTLFHFAGHGRIDANEPSRSCLLLDDWSKHPFTVGDIRDSLSSPSPLLAYLSACSTGSNMVENLSDEGIHLISAFQLAGFKHAIETLWTVSDKHCVDVARVLYETLRDEGMTDLAVGRGLHWGLGQLRAKELEEVGDGRNLVLKGEEISKQYHWVPFVHYGV